MGGTSSACSDFPGITWKPCKLRWGIRDRNTPFSSNKAADFKYVSLGICKGMWKRVVDHDPMKRSGDRTAAYTADHHLFFFWNGICSLLYLNISFVFANSSHDNWIENLYQGFNISFDFACLSIALSLNHQYIFFPDIKASIWSFWWGLNVLPLTPPGKYCHYFFLVCKINNHAKGSTMGDPKWFVIVIPSSVKGFTGSSHGHGAWTKPCFACAFSSYGIYKFKGMNFTPLPFFWIISKFGDKKGFCI